MSSTVTLTASQKAQLSADLAGSPADYVQAYADLNSDIVADESSEGITLGSDTLYWYSQAQYINNTTQPSGEPSWYFIRDVTEYGETLHGLPTGNTQAISNGIATSVLNPIATSGVVTTLPALIGQDISTSLGTNSITDLGAWGGSFYYWAVQPISPAGVTEQAVGVQIAGTLNPALPYDGGNSFDVFLAANGAAILDEAPNLAESGAITFALGALSIPLATQSLMTTLSAGEALAGAQAPPSVLYDLVARAFPTH